MYGAVGFACGIIGQGIANMIMTAKRYGSFSRVFFFFPLHNLLHCRHKVIWIEVWYLIEHYGGS